MKVKVHGYTTEEVRRMADEHVVVGSGLVVNAAVRAGVMTEELWLSRHKEPRL